MTRKIIVNADDLGLSKRVNDAIFQAFAQGLISSATIMANMPAFKEAARLVRQFKLQRKIGLHLNLTSGKPLTDDIASCLRFCDECGCWLPRRRIFRLSEKEILMLEAEIDAQIMACKREGIEPTHIDSHHHMHVEFGITSSVIRMANRHGIGSIRLAFNCGQGREGASAAYHLLVRTVRFIQNTRLRYHRMAHTDYFGNASDTVGILKLTTADVEVMVHPMLDDCGQLIDSNGEALMSRIAALCIPEVEMCSYYGL